MVACLYDVARSIALAIPTGRKTTTPPLDLVVASRGCHGYGTVPPRQYKVIKSRRRKSVWRGGLTKVFSSQVSVAALPSGISPRGLLGNSLSLGPSNAKRGREDNEAG
ncbi:hypothetical protein CDAR_510551 [Caerostris darwini]|uniref:Ribosomal protein L2 n=1 Tax=Caerostris darwini TaxID=1538125 RepID=A0AAV4UGE2_9ARAC|nr:hypothetical protein CDAR_510551 [Caerostris darwini]